MAKKEKTVVPEIVDSVEALEAKMKAMREAQKVFATFTQEQVDKIFYEAAMAANKQRIPLAKMAVEETQRSGHKPVAPGAALGVIEGRSAADCPFKD